MMVARHVVPRNMAPPQTDETVGEERDGRLSHPFPGYVDWLVAIVAALAGVALLVGGSVLVFVVDRGWLVEGARSGSVESTFLSEADAVDVAVALTTWTGLGLLVTGVLLLLGAIGYLVVRRRVRRRETAGEPVDYYRVNVVLGAVVSVVLSFVPFSPALGGAVAGYLERSESERTVSVGALSGLLAMAPMLVVLLFVTVGLVLGVLAIRETGLAVLLATVMLLAVMVVATIGVGLGGLGGYAGGKLAEDRP